MRSGGFSHLDKAGAVQPFIAFSKASQAIEAHLIRAGNLDTPDNARA